MVPILEGKQSLRKSTGVAAMCPALEFFQEISLKDRDDDLARRLRGCVIAEIKELQGLHTREVESIKAFVDKTHESWVPKYKELAIKFPRRVIFFGTTNRSDILNDPTGERRWLPFHVEKIDVEGITRDRNQLWAEGALMFELLGIDWTAEKLAKEAHMQYKTHDAWEDLIDDWLNAPDVEGVLPRDYAELTTADVARGAIGMDASKMNNRDFQRINESLIALGFKQVQRRSAEGRVKRMWSSLKG
jgi:predicted P-loop ATPase